MSKNGNFILLFYQEHRLTDCVKVTIPRILCNVFVVLSTVSPRITETALIGKLISSYRLIKKNIIFQSTVYADHKNLHPTEIHLLFSKGLLKQK